MNGEIHISNRKTRMGDSQLKRTICPIILLIGLIILASPLPGVTQVPNEGIANMVIQARQKNAAQLKQYSWTCRIELTQNGAIQDTRIDQVSYGPDGNLQQTLLNDQSAQLPMGFLRRAIAENRRQQTEQYITDLRGLVDQYTLPSAGAVINFISQANIQSGQAPDGSPVIQMSGTNVVNPGDTFSLTVNPTTFQTRQIQVSTTYQGDAVTVTATFGTSPSGLTYPQYVDVEVPDKQLSLLVQNYDYLPNG
jgi:hypothetical protein